MNELLKLQLMPRKSTEENIKHVWYKTTAF